VSFAFCAFCLFREMDRGSSESKIGVPGRTEVLAPVRIEYLVSKFVIGAK
jgi:hypothetical protein